jgi:ADP-ribose pyrophosphatase YjhB (NUDIX family)
VDATFKLEDKVFNYRVAGVWVENGHVLLHRQAAESYWALPGGRARILEDSKTCLVREMEEELGISVKVERLLWAVENFFPYDGKDYHEIGFYYLISGVENESFYHAGPFFGQEGERLVYEWIPLSEIGAATLYPEFLRKALTELPEAIQHMVISND